MADAARLVDLLTALRAFSESGRLGSTELTRRVRLTVEAARLPDRQSRELAAALGSLAPTAKQAATAALPAHLRRLVYNRPTAAAEPDTPPAAPPRPVPGEPPPGEPV